MAAAYYYVDKVMESLDWRSLRGMNRPPGLAAAATALHLSN